MYYQPPHEVRERSKLAGMIKTLRRGESLPPVLVCGDNALSGSHRLVAWEKMGMQPDVVEMSDEEYCATMVELGLDPMYGNIVDYEDFLITAAALGFAGDAK